MSREALHASRRRPAGRLSLLLLLASALSAANAQLPGININPILNPDVTACLNAPDPTACISNLLPTQENPDVSPDDQGVIHQVEARTAGDIFGVNPPFAIDAASAIPVIHFGHDAAYRACLAQGSLGACNETWNASRPGLHDSQGAEASAAIDAAWQRFNQNMRDDLHKALNTGEPCYTSRPLCAAIYLNIPQPIPLPRPDCIVRKLIDAYPRAFAHHYPAYVAEVLEALVTHLPQSVVYGWNNSQANPLTGSLLAPLFSPDALAFDPSSLLAGLETLATTDPSTLSPDLRAQIYYHEAYLAQLGIHINAPVLPQEVTGEGPGISNFEAAKRDFGAGSAIDQEYKGYAFLYQLRAPITPHVFGKETGGIFPPFKPAVQVYCLEGPPIPFYVFPVPVPGEFPIFQDRTIAVGEGSYIPATNGQLLAFPEILGR